MRAEATDGRTAEIPVQHRKNAHGALTFKIEVVGTYYFSLLMTNRFGSWEYEIGNPDHALMLGKSVVDRRLDGSERVPGT